MADRYAMGIDFGGTKVLAAVVSLGTGEVVASAKKKTRPDDGPEELVQRVFAVAQAALDDAKAGKRSPAISAIGIGMAGQVDPIAGVLLGTPNLAQSSVELPIAARLTERFGVPAVLRNDVHIAAVGEQRFGAGQDAASFLCVFVGTGIGGALVQGGELVTGATGTAGEIGHIIIDAGGRLCGCGGRGHLEAYSSRTAMTKVIMGEVKRGRKTRLTEEMDGGKSGAGAALRSGILSRAVAEGDELVIETVREAGRYLGYGLAGVMNVVNPQRIILGGGVIEAVDLMFDVAAETARREALPVPGRDIEIVRAGLGDNSGVVGAAMIAGEAI
ncbi:MAG: Glucokinase [uncultured Thermomicrobiales bacterium]|uniref:Glucokinase n=1 Tax=uncultured Thermomicrobiales bacterium TaxID=1645740 RepID=A0A6J4UVL3_9BACT|nr:MAG: Glucokinase [uncultured Thermomicrobiales bacterium]